MSEIERQAIAVADELQASVTVAEAARQTRKSVQWWYAAIKEQRVRVLRSGSRVFVPKEELYRLLLAARA